MLWWLGGLTALSVCLALLVGVLLGAWRRHERKLAVLQHQVEIVRTRLLEGGVDLTEDLNVEIKVPEQWRDLDEVSDEEVAVERWPLPGRPLAPRESEDWG